MSSYITLSLLVLILVKTYLNEAVNKEILEFLETSLFLKFNIFNQSFFIE